MKYLSIKKSFALLALAGVTTFTLSAHAAGEWRPKKINWQVIRAQDQNQENICAVRWSYDQSSELIFVKTQNGYEFQLKSLTAQENFPTIKKGDQFNAILTKYDNSITQFFAEATQDNSISINFGKDLVDLDFFSTVQSISFIFESNIIDLPTPNASDNFIAYKQCMDLLTNPIQVAKPKRNAVTQTTAHKTAAPEEKNKPLSDKIADKAYSNLDEINKRGISTPPSLQQDTSIKDRIEETKERNALDGFDLDKISTSDNEVNKSLLTKLSLLEREKEELRKKLLSVTKESMIADIVACEPSAGSNDVMTDIIEEGYKVTIEQLRDENNKLRELISENQDSFSFDE